MKTRLKIISAILVLIGLILACGDDGLEPIVDYRCVVTASSPTGPIFSNTPTPVVLNIQKNESEIGKYDFSYSIISGKGDLLLDNKPIASGVRIPVEIDKVIVSYIPTSLGEHKLKFRFQNEAYFTETIYSVNVGDLMFVAKALNLPKKLLIDKPIAFDLNISQKEESETDEFNAQLKVLKGKGYARFLDANDTLTLQAAAASTRATTSTYKVKIGNNKLNYLSSENGENIILLQIENEYGYQQDLNVPLNIELPEFAVHLTTDTAASVGTVNNFLLNIEDTDNFGDNIYTVTYRNLKNSGTLKLNNNELAVGSSLQLQKGDNVCEFIPNSLGDAALEFIVKDKYNTTKKDTAEFSIGRSYVNIELSGSDSLANVFDTKNFSFSVNKKNYAGNYYFSIEQIPANASTLKINGAEYFGGKSLITNKYNTLVSFIPQHIGNILFKIKVWDDYDSETSKDIHFKVSNTSGSLSVSNHNPIINLFTSTFFNFSISKPNYTGSFQYEINQTAGLMTSGNFGTIKVNGKDYSGGRMEVTNSNNTTVTFTPSKVGDVTLHLKVYDNFGGELSEDLNYSVSNTNLKISATGIAKDILLGNETSFDFTVTKPFYKGQLTCQITTEPSLCGMIKLNNNSYLSGLQYIKSDEPTKVSFSPIVQGPVKLTLKVMDEHGGEARYPVSFNVTNPSIKIESFNFVSNSVINTENISNFTVSKEHYTGDFKYNIETQPTDAGTIKINDQAYTGGNIALSGNENAKLSFFPKVTGPVNLKMTILDNTGGKAVREFIYKVQNPQLQVGLGTLEDDLTLNKKSSFNFTVSKPNYSGKYYYEIDAENCSDLKVGNTSCTIGEHYEVPNAQGTTVSFIPTKVGRDTVKMTLRVFDDWGGVAERKLRFSVTNSDLNLELSNLESSLFVGRETKFNLTATKPGYSGNLKYEIRVSPSGYGTLKVSGEDYLSGQHEIAAGASVPVTFTPIKEGSVNVQVILTDNWSGEKNKSFNYTISSTPIIIEIADHNTDATINSESVCSMSLSKLYYNGNYNYSITTKPENSGIIKVNDQVYTGGRLQVVNPKNTKLSFIPNQTGTIVYQVNITDEIGGQQSKALNFKVENNPIDLIVNNQAVGLTINDETGFNFALQKKNYNGKFQFEIIQEPVSSGTLKVNGKDYAGGRMDVADITNTRVNFTPKVLGDVKLFLKAYDEFGSSTTKELTFSVANSDFKVVVSNQENNIFHSETTKFNFGVLKPNYSGSYQYEIVQSPDKAGTLKINGTAYNGGKIALTRPTLSEVEYTSTTSGQNTLTIKVYDELGGSAQENVIFNCVNSPITLAINNNESNIVYNTQTVFNASITKLHYTGDFQYEIIQYPANSGHLLVDGIEYSGGIQSVTNPKNLQVSFTALTEGRVSLKLLIIDKIGSEALKTIDFNVTNPDLKLDITNHRPDAIVNAASTFNFAVSKAKYTGSFKFQIEQVPAMMGSLKVNNKEYDGALTTLPTSVGNTVSFTPNKTGAVTLKVTVQDDWGKSTTQIVTFSVSNTDIAVNVTNKELDIILNKPSVLNFTVSKPNYTGGFKAKIVQEPAASGSVKLNSSVFSGSTPVNIPANNALEFTPSKAGAALLKLVVSDDLGGEKEVALNYNVTNPDLKLNVTNHLPDLAVNATTTFNFTVSKSNYNGSFKFQITQEPAGRGVIQLNNQVYDGTKITLEKISNIVTFTPSKPGSVTLNLTAEDEWGMSITTPVTFSVSNTDIAVNVTNKELDIILNKPSVLNFTVSKPNYTGGFKAKIVQEPAASGSVKLNSSVFSGSAPVNIPANNALEFTPSKAGAVLLKLVVSDDLGGEKEVALNYNVTNPDLKLSVTNHQPNAIVNAASTFNFTVSKANYNGSFKFNIIQDPVGRGVVTINGKAYDGTKITLEKISNVVTFTPNKTGSVTLYLTAEDEWGMGTTTPVTFSVSNTDIAVNVTNKQFDLLLNTESTLNFTVSKPNYTGSFTAEIIQEPASSGTLKLNSSAYTSGNVGISANNTLSFIPTEVGAALLKLVVSDDLGGKKEVPLNFNVQNPVISLAISNKETNLIYKKSTSFNLAISKQAYSGTYNYEIIQEPVASGSLTVDGKAYNGGIQIVANPNNVLIGYTPTREGYVSLRIKVTDNTGSEAEKTVGFDVVNAPVTLTLNTPGSNSISIGQSASFTMKAEKEGYSGSFNYEVTPVPVDFGSVTVGGKTNLTGTLNPNPSTVSFTPNKTGTVIFNVKVSDTDGKYAEKQVAFSVENTPMNIVFANNEENIVLNNQTSFVFKVAKNNYPDDRMITYTISPAYSGTLIVDGKAYTGTNISLPYSKYKSGIPVLYSPDREGTRSLTFTVQDEFGGLATKNLSFNVSNPELSLYLTGVNTSAANEATLGSTYKFYYNISKANYNDDFSYWITLDPAAVGIVGTSDVTPRGRSARSGGGVQMETGTIRNNQNGATTGEIRFTPSNADYLNQEVKVSIRIRDKWNNEKTAEVRFKIVTSAIEINVNRKTSIDVEVPYTFYFTVNKTGYTGGFKYSLVGWADGDKLEVSANNSTWTSYNGGKFELPNKDHTYVRYTPAAINTIPLRLFIYDETNGEAMQELTFDVKAPEVTIEADATLKQGITNKFIPFQLTATEGKNENVNVSFAVDNSTFNGVLKFNDTEITTSASRSRAAASTIAVESGKENKLEIMAREKGQWGVTTTATNRWKQSASVTTSVNVDDKPQYTLTTSQTGEGTIEKKLGNKVNDGPYEENSVVTLTATAAPSGWKFSQWKGDIVTNANPTTITMDRDKNVMAVFEAVRTFTFWGAGFTVVGGSTNSYRCRGKITVTYKGTPYEASSSAWTTQIKTPRMDNINEYDMVTITYDVEISENGSSVANGRKALIKMTNGGSEYITTGRFVKTTEMQVRSGETTMMHELVRFE